MSPCLRKKTGMSLVEVIIASAAVLLLSVLLISINLIYYRTSDTNLKTIKAIYLTEEGIEAVNFLKNNNWASLGATSTDYYLVWNNSTWIATTTKGYIDQIYERKFFTENVNRDVNNDITLSGGTLDPNTRKLTVWISWSDASGTSTRSISAYLMKSND